jgi:L-histidine N-alpha-methyltransferase
MTTLPDALQGALRQGLQARPRRLPAALLYDALGSTLFEAITFLPEYQLSRMDHAMLEQHAASYVAALPGPLELLELGPGAGRKAAVLLAALCALQERARFVAVDVSAEALLGCSRALASYPGVRVETVEATYLDGLAQAPRSDAARLVCFLGSNLSNFDRTEAAHFFSAVRAHLRPGDGLLIAADLEKPAAELLPAYDDALGVTAAFNRNVLVRLAREAGSTLPLDAFRHVARWNGQARRIEMHLEATRPVRGEILGVPVALELGETLWTESSHRFSLSELHHWGTDAGFRVERSEVSSPWAFAQVLYRVP